MNKKIFKPIQFKIFILFLLLSGFNLSNLWAFKAADRVQDREALLLEQQSRKHQFQQVLPRRASPQVGPNVLRRDIRDLNLLDSELSGYPAVKKLLLRR